MAVGGEVLILSSPEVCPTYEVGAEGVCLHGLAGNPAIINGQQPAHVGSGRCTEPALCQQEGRCLVPGPDNDD